MPQTTDEAVADASALLIYAADSLVDHGPPGVEAHLIAATVQLRAVTALLAVAAKT